MRTQVKAVTPAPHVPMEYALSKSGRTAGGRPEAGREKEKISSLLASLVKQEVKKQLKEQQDYYKSRPSFAAKQMEQMFGQGSFERVLLPAVSRQVYEQLEDRIRLEWLRKGR